MTKMTYSVAIDCALNGNVTDEVKEKLEALKAQLAKRNSGSNKPTKTQRENEGLKESIVAYLEENGAKRANEVGAEFSISGQKASALLKQLVDCGAVTKYIEKRVTYFKVAEDEGAQYLEREVTQ